MAICHRCAGLYLEDGCLYALSSIAFMISSACPGCDFFLKASRRHDVSYEDQPDTQVFLRRAKKHSNLVDVIFVENDVSDLTIGDEFQLRLCDAWGLELPFCVDYEENEDTEYLGRLVSHDSGNKECLNLAKSWMERCTQSHGALCTLPKEVALPTRLIQIQRDDPAILKLCTTAGMRGQYVTLSYCWGDGPSFKAVSTSMESLRSGFEAQSLPKTLRDAVRLTYEMGFEYIWIDSLCIQQDNFEDWSRESARMAQVYGDAAFTICADIAGSTNDGIFQARDNLQSHRFGPELSFCLQTISQQWGEMPEHPLYSRGWAFQERILSSRNLHFLNDQIAWECNTTLYLEDSRGRHSNPTDHFAKSIFTKFYHAKRFQEFNKQSEPDLFPRIGAWNAIAQEMSVRAFTFESDNLPAISGLASALQTPELGEYLAGVWSYNPFLSMAWFPRWAQSPSSNYISPSWSWVWTQHQIVWHYDTWSEDKPRGPQEVADWKVWDSAFGPQLLEHKMIYKGLDPKGELLEGSYLVMSGYCRTVYVVEVPGSDADRNFQEVAGSTGIPNEKGIRVCMDMRIDNCDSVSSFAQDFSDPEDAISFEHAKGYLCVQIARERKRRDWNPKVIALVLEKTADTTDHVYKRVGLMNFDAVDEDKWDHKTLKLL